MAVDGQHTPVKEIVAGRSFHQARGGYVGVANVGLSSNWLSNHLAMANLYGFGRLACVDACPVDCIHPKKDDPRHATEEMLYIDPVECIDCGACVPVCPVSAIFALDDLPEKWAAFTERNAKYYGR